MPECKCALERVRGRVRRRERDMEGGRESRKEGSAQAYLLFLASSLPAPLADAEGAGGSDDILWRTSTLWPFSPGHTRTASSLWVRR